MGFPLEFRASFAKIYKEFVWLQMQTPYSHLTQFNWRTNATETFVSCFVLFFLLLLFCLLAL